LFSLLLRSLPPGFYLNPDLTLAVSCTHGPDKPGFIVRIEFILGGQGKCHAALEHPITAGSRSHALAEERTAPVDEDGTVVAHVDDLFLETGTKKDCVDDAQALGDLAGILHRQLEESCNIECEIGKFHPDLLFAFIIGITHNGAKDMFVQQGYAGGTLGAKLPLGLIGD